ncbi:Oidioi.mRNA.OKI2018_I69.PAR.g11216.t1.cds [Oikopleura dioica]|uniref:Oidioi.mRNA.OKI2018_I69.PAR.g11216.t1.cds n=1 Tax=Oikopleura dioica TaxID=34765 RepID=A0ABN7RXX7_OIKDI|nr:Oidioi.mRNA.OKI2018_I69.PAR.g11216.t1.cds [Oikopleura dioica]
MLNHSRSNNAEFEFDHNTGRLLVTCISPIKAGEQLFISYGSRPDDDLLLEYGFCLGSDGDLQPNRVVFSQRQVADACFTIAGVTKSTFDEKIELSRSIYASNIENFFDFEATDNLLCATKELIHPKLITFVVWLNISTIQDMEARDGLGGSACRLGEMIQGSCKILREEGKDICRHWLEKLQ